MPATKKIVNPEKELRGKKPYNRDPNGLKKKTYQAKPKRLDDNEVPEGAAALKKKLRDTLRLLSKNPKMPADVRLEHERRIEALKLQIAEKQVDQTEQKMATKYRMIKFFESKKADRKIKVFMRQHPNWESNEDERKELESLKLDLAYIQHYPKTQKYISLYPNENADDPVVSKTRAEIREKIRIGLESGEITQFIKATREEVKTKIINKDKLTTDEAIKLTTEKINSSKKRARDEQDPLSARAKATAEREATKPKQAAGEEEETFFEAVPKATEASEVKESTKKKTNAPAPQPKKEQPKKEQPKKQAKKGQSKEQNEKIEATEEASATNTATEPVEGGEVKKLGKWARKALRAQSVIAAKKETETAEDSTATEEASVAEATEENKEPVEKKQTAEKKPQGKKRSAKDVEKVVEKVVEKEDDKPKEQVKLDAPKITILKVDHNDKGESDSDDDDDDEPVVPVRKVVKIDETLLKELPEVPKRRGGRNQNKFKK
ncbi:18S rRNA maturation protein [Mortierella sp. AD011]|nr:18S rRNA maturation protein [Mortierella sp. AD010]KAF9374855.1 18S rRNA maturation protein [Mortierella sp. AD011]